MSREQPVSFEDASDEQVWERRMYRLIPAPPKRELDEYIHLYAETGQADYFLAFLHFYEPSLNRRTMRYCRNYWVMHLFPDVKQTIVTVLFEYAKQYDSNIGVSFLAYTKLMVQEAVREFVRQNGGVHSIANVNYFRRLAKTNALYYAGLDVGFTPKQCIVQIAEQINTTADKVRALIAEGEAFRDFKSLAIRTRIRDEGEEPDVYERYDRGDKTADPGEVVPDALFMDELIDAIDELPYKQRQILYESCGIRCMACGRVGSRFTYAELANRFELYSESAAEKQRKAAIQKVREVVPNPYL